MLMGKLALALEDKEHQQAKGAHVLMGLRIVEARPVLLLCHFWRLSAIIDPVRHALQVRGRTPAQFIMLRIVLSAWEMSAARQNQDTRVQSLCLALGGHKTKR